MFVLNGTMFITSRLIITHGYWFPLIAASLYLSAYGMMLFPWTNLKSIRVYWTLFCLTVVGTYFTVASIVYYLQHHASVPLR